MTEVQVEALREHLMELRGEARLYWMSGASPRMNPDVRAVHRDVARHLAGTANALHAALTALGITGLGPTVELETNTVQEAESRTP